MLATEFNSVYANPGKQSTSLVNGLFVADALGGLLKTEYNGADVWDLRNGWGTGNNNAATLYGWRQGGDYGLLGSSGGPAPATGTYIPYPTYFAEQLVSKLAHTGDTVVYSSSSDANLDVFAVKQANGHLELMLINKSATSSVTGQFQINGFTPFTQAQLWQYGIAQDTAQSQTTDGHSALANSTAPLTVTGSEFQLRVSRVLDERSGFGSRERADHCHRVGLGNQRCLWAADHLHGHRLQRHGHTGGER